MNLTFADSRTFDTEFMMFLKWHQKMLTYRAFDLLSGKFFFILYHVLYFYLQWWWHGRNCCSENEGNKKFPKNENQQWVYGSFQCDRRTLRTSESRWWVNYWCKWIRSQFGFAYKTWLVKVMMQTFIFEPIKVHFNHLRWLFKILTSVLGKGEAKLSLSLETLRKLRETRSIVEDIVQKGYVRYGINTGFGLLSKVVVENDKLVELQYNIVRCVVLCCKRLG